MLGDIILYVKEFIKQQTCIHKYINVHRKDTGGSFEMCINCEKSKIK
jgi:hypothetical protein